MNLLPLQPPLWVCHRCDMRFDYRSRLRKHTTTGACRYVTQTCCVCYELYERACDLRRHLKERHGHVYPSYLPPRRSKTELARIGVSIRGWRRGPRLTNYRVPARVPVVVTEIRPGRVVVVAPTQPLGRATTLRMMLETFPPLMESPTYGEEELARKRIIRAYKPLPPCPRMSNRPEPDSESEFEDAVEPEVYMKCRPIHTEAGKRRLKTWCLRTLLKRMMRAVTPWAW